MEPGLQPAGTRSVATEPAAKRRKGKARHLSGGTGGPTREESRKGRHSDQAQEARGLQVEIKQKTPFGSREQEAYLALQRTADVLQSQVEAKLKEFGLTPTQYNALRILRGAGREGLPCSEISERMITRDPDITRLLNRLEKRGLTSRTRDRHDRRVIYGKISKDGLKLLSEMDTPLQQFGRELLAHVGQTNLRQLIELLELVRTKRNQLGLSAKVAD
jgi:MarR family transcriptional regulator, organic hydroperoxide resistance regulator